MSYIHCPKKTKSERSQKRGNKGQSKGRKIRYQVHDKLVGFTAPHPRPVVFGEHWGEQLFGNLFGIKTSH